MSEVSEAAKAKACEILDAARSKNGWPTYPLDGFKAFPKHVALADYIQQVSDAAERVSQYAADDAPELAAAELAPFILPDPDPLLEAMRDLRRNHQCDPVQFGEQLVAALAKHGLEIRERGK